VGNFFFFLLLPLKLIRSNNVAMGHNVFALGAVADFGAINLQPTTKADARHNVE
jgi:hypothetical protein